MSLQGFENELLTEWTQKMHYNEDQYVEPTLDYKSVNLIKIACTTLKQDIHVVVMSVEILESYIRKKELNREAIKDPALTVGAVIFIASKYMGDQDLKVQYIESFLCKITGQNYNFKTIKKTEMEVLATIGNKLPITTLVDDLNTFIAKYERDCNIKAAIRPLCLDILEILYLKKVTWFYELKSIYVQNEEALQVFKKLICCKFYLPLGILIYVLKVTKYRLSLNVEKIMDDFSNNLQIHADHINILVSKISETVTGAKS